MPRDYCRAAAALAWLMLGPAFHSVAQIHVENFDDSAAGSRLTEPFFSAENSLPFDGFVDPALDYSIFGIAPAPNSVGDTTIGLGIQVNNFPDGVDEGIAIGVSPIIQSLPTDYVVKVDVIIQYNLGPGASEHAVLGVNAASTGVPFTFVPTVSGQFYHVPHDSGLLAPGFADDYYRVNDAVVTELYNDDPNDAIPHPDTLGIVFPADPPPPLSEPGYAGSQWIELELRKTGNMLTFLVNGVQIDQYESGAGSFSGNIVLGGADIFNSVNADNWIIFDNLRVEAPASESADFNGDGDVDGADFLVWQANSGLLSGATLAQGDANGDGVVNDGDFAVWRAQFGNSAVAAFSQVPEPKAIVVEMLAAGLTAGACSRKRKLQAVIR